MVLVDSGLHPIRLPPGRSMSEVAFVNAMQRPPSFGTGRSNRSVAERISQYAFNVFAVIMFTTLNSVFVPGFLCGVVAHEYCEAMIENLKERLPPVFFSNGLVGMVLFGFAGLRAWAALILAACFLTGASVGASAHRYAQLDS